MLLYILWNVCMSVCRYIRKWRDIHGARGLLSSFGWMAQTSCILIFPPMILIYRRDNFVFHNLGCMYSVTNSAFIVLSLKINGDIKFWETLKVPIMKNKTTPCTIKIIGCKVWTMIDIKPTYQDMIKVPKVF